jgi:hypothetical protein
MKDIAIVVLLGLAILAPLTPAFSEIDLSTGLEAEDVVSGPSVVRDDANVLWDLTHGVYANYDPEGRFSGVKNLMGAAGFVSTTTTAGVDNIDLSQFDVVILCLGCAWYSSYTYSEVTALLDFEAAGGGLLILSDNHQCPIGNLDPVLAPFGIAQAGTTIQPSDLYIRHFLSRPIFSGIHTLFFRHAGELIISSPPAVEAATAPTGEVAIGLVDDCRVVVTGDFNFMANSYIHEEDNLAFILNVLDCLADPGPVTTDRETLGGLKARFR